MNLVFHVGGPDFHPVEAQAQRVIEWLGEDYNCRICHGAEAFENLDDCDLLVVMGLFWTGGEAYQPLQESHKTAFEKYVASGRPLVLHHGAIASYDDWPRFGELCGFAWIWGTTSHSPVDDYTVRVLPTSHPIVAGVEDYRLHDELYYDLQIAPDVQPQTHALASWEGRELPMIMTAEGGRVEGAGRVTYLANGHDMKAFECAAMKQIWRNAVKWSCDKN